MKGKLAISLTLVSIQCCELFFENIAEQTAQIIVVNDFYDSLETMKSYRESMDAIPKEFEDKWKELQGILEEAKGRWEEKFGRSLCERVSNLLKRKRE